jgi:hypothetical protein
MRREADAGKKYIILGILIWVLAMATICGTLAFRVTGPDYTYNAAVHSHFENAYYSADPETMKTEILKAKEGMKELGLDPQMNSKFWSWEKTYDYSMDWQYRHIDSIIIRINEFIAWANAQNNTGSQQMGDVYTQKLNNVREFVKNDGGWSDDIAYSAFYVYNHVFVQVYIPIIVLLVIVVGFVFFANGLRLT